MAAGCLLRDGSDVWAAGIRWTARGEVRRARRRGFVSGRCHAPDMTRSVPPPGDLVKLIRACSLHAQELVCDARTLLDAGRPSSAFPLASLALEELAKSVICFTYLILAAFDDTDPDRAPEFWRFWLDHKSKLELGISSQERWSVSLSEFQALLADKARDTHSRKMQGFYVDYREGVVLTPSDISITEARELIEIATTSLEAFRFDEDDDLSLDECAFVAQEAPTMLKATLKAFWRPVFAELEEISVQPKTTLNTLEAAFCEKANAAVKQMEERGNTARQPFP